MAKVWWLQPNQLRLQIPYEWQKPQYHWNACLFRPYSWDKNLLKSRSKEPVLIVFAKVWVYFSLSTSPSHFSVSSFSLSLLLSGQVYRWPPSHYRQQWDSLCRTYLPEAECGSHPSLTSQGQEGDVFRKAFVSRLSWLANMHLAFGYFMPWLSKQHWVFFSGKKQRDGR